MANADVRQKIKKSNVYHWEVADAIGISERTFSNWMRKELPPEKKQEIFKAIERIEYVKYEKNEQPIMNQMTEKEWLANTSLWIHRVLKSSMPITPHKSYIALEYLKQLVDFFEKFINSESELSVMDSCYMLQEHDQEQVYDIDATVNGCIRLTQEMVFRF